MDAREFQCSNEGKVCIWHAAFVSAIQMQINTYVGLVVFDMLGILISISFTFWYFLNSLEIFFF